MGQIAAPYSSYLEYKGRQIKCLQFVLWQVAAEIVFSPISLQSWKDIGGKTVLS